MLKKSESKKNYLWYYLDKDVRLIIYSLLICLIISWLFISLSMWRII